MSKSNLTQDWSEREAEGSEEESINQGHDKVGREIEESLKESKRLLAAIDKISRNQDVILWLKNVSFQVKWEDMEEYLKQHNIRSRKISTTNAGVFKISLDHQNAIKLASIPDNVLMNRRMIVQLDSRQDPDRPKRERQPNRDPNITNRHSNSYTQEPQGARYRQKEQPLVSKHSSENGDLLRLFQSLKLSNEHEQIIKSLRQNKV